MLTQDILILWEGILPPDVHTFQDRSLDDGVKWEWGECCLVPAFCTAKQEDLSML